MKKLIEIYNNIQLVSDKWLPYFDVYEQYFEKFRDKSPTVVEVGVQNGGSIEAWVEYFGKDSEIYGIDIEDCPEIDNAIIIKGNQSNPLFWDNFLQKVNNIDCFIDDGSHIFHDQILTFIKVWPHINPGGVYVCEDTVTSYWEDYGGKLKHPDSFIEFAKEIADGIHIEHIQDQPPEDFKNLISDVGFVGFYHGQVVFTKGKKPFTRIMINGGNGNPNFINKIPQ